MNIYLYLLQCWQAPSALASLHTSPSPQLSLDHIRAYTSHFVVLMHSLFCFEIGFARDCIFDLVDLNFQLDLRILWDLVQIDRLAGLRCRCIGYQWMRCYSGLVVGLITLELQGLHLRLDFHILEWRCACLLVAGAIWQVGLERCSHMNFTAIKRLGRSEPVPIASSIVIAATITPGPERCPTLLFAGWALAAAISNCQA